MPCSSSALLEDVAKVCRGTKSQSGGAQLVRTRDQWLRWLSPCELRRGGSERDRKPRRTPHAGGSWIVMHKAVKSSCVVKLTSFRRSSTRGPRIGFRYTGGWACEPTTANCLPPTRAARTSPCFAPSTTLARHGEISTAWAISM